MAVSVAWQSCCPYSLSRSKPHEVANAVRIALESGYKHIDGAAIYGNENEVGEGIKASGVPRDSFFLTVSWIPANLPANHIE